MKFEFELNINIVTALHAAKGCDRLIVEHRYNLIALHAGKGKGQGNARSDFMCAEHLYNLPILHSNDDIQHGMT